MHHSKERTTVHTIIVLTEQEAAWLREALGEVVTPQSEPLDAFLTDLYDALAT